MLELWPFQKRVVGMAQRALKQHRSICIVLPTGSGKTAVAANITHRIAKQFDVAKRSGIGLFLVHRRELLTQTARTMDRIGLEGQYGMIAAGHAAAPWAAFQIASIPTLVRRLDKYPLLHPKVIFVDEAHHASAETWAKIIRRWPDAFVIGLTATPARTDDKGLAHIFEHLVLGPTIKDLTPKYLSPVRAVTVPENFRMRARTIKAQAEQLTEGPVIANAVDTWEKYAKGLKTIFFCINIDHSKQVTARLQEKGIRAEHLDFETPESQRDAIMQRIWGGSVDVVCNSQIFTEGTDWPECQCVVMARFTKSIVQYRQMNGRAMRRKADGGEALLIDLAGNVWEHGFPDADIEWSLTDGVTKDEKRKAASNVRRCELCGFAYPRVEPNCPACGHAPPKKEFLEVDVDMIEVGERKPPRASKRKLNEELMATDGSYKAVDAIRRKYGYHPRWTHQIRKVYKFRTGGK